jgi:hypothetical protein
MTALPAAIRYVRNVTLPQAHLGPENIVLLNAERGKYYDLTGTALRIWELLETPRTLDQICDELLREFHIDVGQCREQTCGFLDQLVEEQLISVEGA